LFYAPCGLYSCTVLSRCELTEEEANLLRLYVDQPGYVDLHWVCLSTICFFFLIIQ
jgi:hypothetical protein